MKSKSFLLATAISVATLLGLTSCSEENRLASQLTGEWSGSPENIADNTAITATLIETYTIGEPSPTDKTSGEMTINGVVSATTQLVGDSTLTEPVTVSAGAISSV
ncbi:MAG: hypothetical protein K2K55_03990, partial [Duncaniella sp.]|nr:hypothetical protein [Duncaniella sp.]